MDRGFGSFRGSGYGGNSGPNRQVSDRRYDDFYSDGRRGPPPPAGRSGGGGRNRNSGDWGGANRDRDFFNQGQGGRDRGSGNVSGQMLAALQQQQHLLSAFMSSQSRRGILPSPRGGGNSFGQGRNSGNRYGGDNRYGNRPGDKRKIDTQRPSGFQNKKKPPPTPPNKASDRKTATGSRKSSSQEKTKPKLPTPQKEEEIDIPDSEVEVPDSLMDSVEKLRQRKEVQRNVADEDIQKLVVFCFTGKGYQCRTCGLLLTKESAFLSHLDGKSHVMNVIDARTAKKYQESRDILDIDLAPDDWYEKSEKARAIILKQAKMFMKTQRELKQREIDNYNKNPANFFTVTMETRKAAVKRGTSVTIKSIVETSMEVKEFGSDRHFGCEFIKAVSGFNCRLCGLNITDSVGVIPHVESRLHKSNYQTHLRKAPGYEKVQSDQNKELRDALGEHEDSFILLSESALAETQTFLAAMDPHLVRVAKLFKPDPADTTAAQKEEEEAAAAAAAESSTEEKKAEEVKNDDEKKDDDNAMEVEAEKDAAEADVPAKETESEEEADAPAEEPVDAEEETSENVEVKEEEQPMEEVDPYAIIEGEGEGEGSQDDVAKAEDEYEEKDVTENGEEHQAEAKKESPQPKKSILKKTPTRTPRGALAKRGRGRGGKVTPSPRSRVKKVKEAAAPEPSVESELQQEDSNDGTFMDGFQVVDEVAED